MRVVKAVLLSCAVALLYPLSAAGQNSLGFQGGLSYTTFGGSDIESSEIDYRAGFRLGAFMEIRLTDLFSLQPEVHFAQKGAKESDSGVTGTVKLSYMEAPILLRFNLPTNGTISPFVVAGPALGYRLTCEIEVEAEGVSVSADCEESDAEIKVFDLGAALGAGVGFDVGPGKAIIAARYNLGLVSIDDSYEEDDVKNRAFAFMVGYSFEIGG